MWRCGKELSRKAIEGLGLFFPFTKASATTEPAVASLFNKFFSFPDLLLSFSCTPHSWPAGIHCLPFPPTCYFQIIARGFMLKSALGADFLGQQLSVMETNAARDWDKWRSEGNKKHALSSPHAVQQGAAIIHFILIKNKPFPPKGPWCNEAPEGSITLNYIKLNFMKLWLVWKPGGIRLIVMAEKRLSW